MYISQCRPLLPDRIICEPGSTQNRSHDQRDYQDGFRPYRRKRDLHDSVSAIIIKADIRANRIASGRLLMASATRAARMTAPGCPGWLRSFYKQSVKKKYLYAVLSQDSERRLQMPTAAGTRRQPWTSEWAAVPAYWREASPIACEGWESAASRDGDDGHRQTGLWSGEQRGWIDDMTKVTMWKDFGRVLNAVGDHLPHEPGYARRVQVMTTLNYARLVQ
jgi:hypothetical protein